MQRSSGPKKGQAEFYAGPGKASTKQDQQAIKKKKFSKTLSSISNSATPLFSRSKLHLHDEWKIFLLYKAKFSLGSSLI